MGRTLGLAVLDNPEVDQGDLCSALGLAEAGGRALTLAQAAAPSISDRWIAVGTIEPFVLVVHSYLHEYTRAWEELTWGGRALVFHLSEGALDNTWALYENGRKVRWVEQTPEREAGEPHLLERRLTPGLTPAEAIAVLFGSMTGRDLFSEEVLSLPMRAWRA